MARVEALKGSWGHVVKSFTLLMSQGPEATKNLGGFCAGGLGEQGRGFGIGCVSWTPCGWAQGLIDVGDKPIANCCGG